MDPQSNSNQPNLKRFIQSWKMIFSQSDLSCSATHVDGDKEAKMANNRTAEFSDKSGLSYSYKVPDQLQVGFPLDF